MFPKKGKGFRSVRGTGEPRLSYAASIAMALRSELGDSHLASGRGQAKDAADVGLI
jgi:hypothetical protein